ncbi:MAG: cbb3-type cytochrome oxidase assembly protein CcoS [SAR324 cluster bacterium]|jgi:cbb3-type cytochrome oxidase maturation protein|nr:cbb3-type cytochrome oxidase assembly protein CcoS [SAR324 cluster bacterium]|tara:strand:- start:220 stop:459 length:240 start_codon:yes stop_codon:yes gene_type:complete
MDILPLLIGISLSLGLIGLLGFLWGMQHGMFDDPEGTRYRILLDDQEEDEYQKMLVNEEAKTENHKNGLAQKNTSGEKL